MRGFYYISFDGNWRWAGEKINSRDKTDLSKKKTCVISAFMRAFYVAGDSFMSICSTLTINPRIKYGWQQEIHPLSEERRDALK